MDKWSQEEFPTQGATPASPQCLHWGHEKGEWKYSCCACSGIPGGCEFCEKDWVRELEVTPTYAYSPSYEPTPYMARVPLSAPVWVWVLYVGFVLLMAVGGTAAGFYPLYPVIFTALFSFQFWTYAIWRGYCIDYAKFRAEHELA